MRRSSSKTKRKCNRSHQQSHEKHVQAEPVDEQNQPSGHANFDCFAEEAQKRVQEEVSVEEHELRSERVQLEPAEKPNQK